MAIAIAVVVGMIIGASLFAVWLAAQFWDTWR